MSNMENNVAAETEYHTVRKTVETMLTIVETEVEKLNMLINARQNITAADLHKTVTNVHSYVYNHVL